MKSINPQNLLVPDFDKLTNIDNKTLCGYMTSLHDTINAYPDTYMVSNEGLITFTRKFVFGIANTFFHVANNFKTLFKSYRDFKRSELSYYKESNLVTFNRIMSQDYKSLVSVMVPIPHGMMKPYYPSMVALNDALTLMNMQQRITPLLKAVKEIQKSIMVQSESEKISRQSVTNLTNLFDVKNLKRHQDTVDTCFTNKSTDKIRFDKAFRDDTEFKRAIELGLQMDAYLIGCSTICKVMEDIENMFQDIIKACEDKEIVIVKNDMVTLSELTLMLATVFDSYGTWVNDVNRVQHNLMLILKQLAKIS